MSSVEKIGTFVADDGFQLFWTAFDPLELESGSIDPLGFLRGYLALADRLFGGGRRVRPRENHPLPAGVDPA